MSSSGKILLFEKESITAYGICELLALIGALASDFLSPLAPFTTMLFVVSCVAAGGFGTVFHFSQKRKWREFTHFALIAASTFLFFNIMQTFAPTERVGQSRGLAATASSGVAKFQTAILPLDTSTRVLFRLEDQLRSGNTVSRIAAMRDAFDLKDKDEKRIALQLVLGLGDAPSRQTAILAVLTMRLNTEMPIVSASAEASTELDRALMGAHLKLSRVDTDSGAIAGTLTMNGNYQTMQGTVALSRVVLASVIYIGNPKMWIPVTINLKPDESGTLSGMLRTAGGKSAQVEIPLL